jgi:hypothetical protein
MVDRITPVSTAEHIETFSQKTNIADKAAVVSERFRQRAIVDDFAARTSEQAKPVAQAFFQPKLGFLILIAIRAILFSSPKSGPPSARSVARARDQRGRCRSIH